MCWTSKLPPFGQWIVADGPLLPCDGRWLGLEPFNPVQEERALTRRRFACCLGLPFVTFFQIRWLHGSYQVASMSFNTSFFQFWLLFAILQCMVSGALIICIIVSMCTKKSIENRHAAYTFIAILNLWSRLRAVVVHPLEHDSIMVALLLPLGYELRLAAIQLVVFGQISAMISLVNVPLHALYLARWKWGMSNNMVVPPAVNSTTEHVIQYPDSALAHYIATFGAILIIEILALGTLSTASCKACNSCLGPWQRRSATSVVHPQQIGTATVSSYTTLMPSPSATVHSATCYSAAVGPPTLAWAASSLPSARPASPNSAASCQAASFSSTRLAASNSAAFGSLTWAASSSSASGPTAPNSAVFNSSSVACEASSSAAAGQAPVTAGTDDGLKVDSVGSAEDLGSGQGTSWAGPAVDEDGHILAEVMAQLADEAAHVAGIARGQSTFTPPIEAREAREAAITSVSANVPPPAVEATVDGETALARSLAVSLEESTGYDGFVEHDQDATHVATAFYIPQPLQVGINALRQRSSSPVPSKNVIIAYDSVTRCQLQQVATHDQLARRRARQIILNDLVAAYLVCRRGFLPRDVMREVLMFLGRHWRRALEEFHTPEFPQRTLTMVELPTLDYIQQITANEDAANSDASSEGSVASLWSRLQDFINRYL